MVFSGDLLSMVQDCVLRKRHASRIGLWTYISFLVSQKESMSGG
ncbi:hypothetical protein ABMA08_00870 [Pseudomonas yamanorum]